MNNDEDSYIWNSSLHGTESLQKFREAISTDIARIPAVQDQPQVVLVLFRDRHVIDLYGACQTSEKRVPFHLVLLFNVKIHCRQLYRRI